MQTRLFRFDFIRAIAAVAVVLIHTTSAYVLSDDHAYILNQAARFAVPIFILISGFLLYYTDKNTDRMDYFGFLGKRLKKIIIPYFLWTVAYDIFYSRHNIASIFTEKGLWDFLRYITTGLDHLYFMAIIIQLYLIYPLIKMLFKKNLGNITLLISFLISLYFQLGAFLMSMNIMILPKILRSYNYVLFPCWIFYFVLGMYLARHQGRWERLLAHKVKLLVLWIVCLAAHIAESRITNTFELSIKPLLIFYTVLTFFVLYAAADYVTKTGVLHKFVSWLSQQSFLFYLSHVLMMRVSYSAAYVMGFGNIWDGKEGLLLYSLVTVVTTSIFVYMVSLTPLAPYLGGVRKMRPNYHGTAAR